MKALMALAACLFAVASIGGASAQGNPPAAELLAAAERGDAEATRRPLAHARQRGYDAMTKLLAAAGAR